MPASGPVSRAEQCSAGTWVEWQEGGWGMWGGSTHRIISARQDAFVYALSLGK